MASTITASSFEVGESGMAPKEVIYYPEENTVRLMFSSREASLEEEYSIYTDGLYTIDENIAELNKNSTYLTNFNEGEVDTPCVMSLSICDEDGKSISYAKKSDYYTLKLMYTNPGVKGINTITVKNGSDVLSTFNIDDEWVNCKTLTKRIWIVAGEVFDLSCEIN